MNLHSLTPAELAPVDQFHTAGREATIELARRASLPAGATVLDVGGGIGGPARTLASDFGCAVTVLDLTEAFCRAGEVLTDLTGLSALVNFCHGVALALPFDVASFDVVWSQHSTMNIPDKDRLYREIRRVLRPGGRLAFHEIMAGPVKPVHFPVPWAREPAISFLRSPAEVRALLADLGFREVAWVDTTAASLAWFRAWTARPAASATPGPLGLHLLLGPDFPAMGRNQVRNLEEDRIALIQAVFDRP
jgi:SAM-dependent methyltransferase